MGHVGPCEDKEEPPAAVAVAVLQRRAGIMFSGNTGAVVSSEEGLATSAPSYGLMKDVVKVVEALPAALFDRSRRAPPVWAPRQVRRAGHAHWRRPRAPADAVGAGGARRQGRGQAPKAKLELAQVRYRHALRRLQCAYPGELCGFSQNSAREMVHWAIRVEALAGPVPAARAAACKVGFDFNTAVSNTRNQLEMARDRS